MKSKSPFTLFFNFGGDKSVGLNDVILNSGKPINPLTQRIASLRKVKSPAEIEVMHAAGQISSRAINKAIGQVGSKDPIATEKTLAKYLEYQFVRGGCDKQAYIPVVASGSNALTIHYTRNDDLLYRDELVLLMPEENSVDIVLIFQERGQIHQKGLVSLKGIYMKLY